MTTCSKIHATLVVFAVTYHLVYLIHNRRKPQIYMIEASYREGKESRKRVA